MQRNRESTNERGKEKRRDLCVCVRDKICTEQKLFQFSYHFVEDLFIDLIM